MSSLIVCVTRMATLVYVVTDRLCDKNGPALMSSLIDFLIIMARLVYVVTDRLCDKND